MNEKKPWEDKKQLRKRLTKLQYEVTQSKGQSHLLIMNIGI